MFALAILLVNVLCSEFSKATNCGTNWSSFTLIISCYSNSRDTVDSSKVALKKPSYVIHRHHTIDAPEI